MHPHRGVSAKVAFALGVLAIATAATTAVPAAAAVLNPVATFVDGVDGVTGLQSVRTVVVSPDGKNVYTAGEGESAITVWSRAHNGSIKEIQVLVDKQDGITDITFVDNLSVSPDGKNVYASGILSKSFVTFARNPSTGELTEVQVLHDGVDVPSGLNGVVYNVTSPDGRNVYSVATLDGAVVAFSRNRSNGHLTPIQVIQEGVGGVTGLTGAFPAAVSADGKNVYVGSRHDPNLLVFSRAANGKLTLIQNLQEGTGGVLGIAGARYILQSFQGNNVYVAGDTHNDIVQFARDPGTGMLTQVGITIWHLHGVLGLSTPTFLVQSFDHGHLFTNGFDTNSLDSFHLDRRTGAVGVQEQLSFDPGDGSVNPGLIEIIAGAMSPGGQNLYTVGFFDGTLNVWKITEVSHEPSDADAVEAVEDNSPN
jgi:6-phosphogluconolactonase (cycloisomerase 2 family)